MGDLDLVGHSGAALGMAACFATLALIDHLGLSEGDRAAIFNDAAEALANRHSGTTEDAINVVRKLARTQKGIGTSL
jgi:hypothetical protein